MDGQINRNTSSRIRHSFINRFPEQRRAPWHQSRRSYKYKIDLYIKYHFYTYILHVTCEADTWGRLRSTSWRRSGGRTPRTPPGWSRRSPPVPACWPAPRPPATPRTLGPRGWRPAPGPPAPPALGSPARAAAARAGPPGACSRLWGRTDRRTNAVIGEWIGSPDTRSRHCKSRNFVPW